MITKCPISKTRRAPRSLVNKGRFVLLLDFPLVVEPLAHYAGIHLTVDERKVEAEKKEAERQQKLEGVKDSLRKKRKRKGAGGEEDGVKSISSAGTKAGKPSAKKKSVSFA